MRGLCYPYCVVRALLAPLPTLAIISILLWSARDAVGFCQSHTNFSLRGRTLSPLAEYWGRGLNWDPSYTTEAFYNCVLSLRIPMGPVRFLYTSFEFQKESRVYRDIQSTIYMYIWLLGRIHPLEFRFQASHTQLDTPSSITTRWSYCLHACR